jgi:hypothetical protein
MKIYRFFLFLKRDPYVNEIQNDQNVQEIKGQKYLPPQSQATNKKMFIADVNHKRIQLIRKKKH